MRYQDNHTLTISTMNKFYNERRKNFGTLELYLYFFLNFGIVPLLFREFGIVPYFVRLLGIYTYQG